MPRGPLRMLRRPVVRKRNGTFAIRLDPDELDLLGSLADQLDPMLDDPSANPMLRRLFPPAHPDDLLSEAEWQIERGGSLRDSHRAALDALRRPVEAPLTEDELVEWMQGVNALRLVLSERLGVSDDPDQEADIITAASALAAGDDPARAEAARQLLGSWQVYGFLAWMVDGAVRALGDPEFEPSVPEPPPGDDDPDPDPDIDVG